MLGHPFSMLVSRPSGSGKTTWVKKLLEGGLAGVERIVWVYRHWQPLYEELKDVQFVRGIPDNVDSDEFLDETDLIVFDDVMRDCAKDKRISALFTEGSHHKGVSVILLVQNLYFTSDPTIRRNANYLVLFNSIVDRQQISTLSRQISSEKPTFMLRKYEEATSKPYGYLFINLRASVPEKDRFKMPSPEEKPKCDVMMEHVVKVNEEEFEAKKKQFIEMGYVEEDASSMATIAMRRRDLEVFHELMEFVKGCYKETRGLKDVERIEFIRK